METTAPIATKLCIAAKTDKYCLCVVRTRIQQIQDGRHLGEIYKSIYHRNGLTDLDEIWHDDAYWTPGRQRPPRFYTVQKTKMADDHYRK